MARTLAVGPGLVFSTLLVTVLLAALAPVAAAVVVAVGCAAAGLLLAGRGEGASARLLYLARPIRDVEVAQIATALTLLCRAGLGPPLVSVRVRDHEASVAAAGFGRCTIIVSTGLIEAVGEGTLPQDEAAAVIARAAVLTQDGWYRRDPLLMFWSMPWSCITTVAQLVASIGRRLPLTQAAWRLRIMVLSIAVVQGLQAHQFGLAAAVAGIGVLSYAMPVWQRRWQQRLLLAGDRAVAEAGFAAPLVAFLRRCPSTPRVRERILALTPAVEPAPLGLVRVR